MAVLDSFGFSQFTEAFRKSGGVHEVWNLLSLDHNLHQTFDRLGMWFEGAEKVRYTDIRSVTLADSVQPDHYQVRVLEHWDELYIYDHFKRRMPHIDGAPMTVDFTSRYNNAPPPDPRLLALHAMCPRVAHRSGAAEYFDRVERDKEELKVLALDGSSSVLLDHLLSPFAAVEIVS